ncbi:hypothetical protein BV901_22610 [Serratia nematodiphila]|nr:hypothetical protein BV901_22610 [Serratia nematodiphila]
MKNQLALATVLSVFIVGCCHAMNATVNMTQNGTNPPYDVSMSYSGDRGERVYETAGITCIMQAYLIAPEHKGVSRRYTYTNTRMNSHGGYVIKGYPNDYCAGIQQPEGDKVGSHERDAEWMAALGRIGYQNLSLPYGWAPVDLTGVGNTEWVCGIFVSINDFSSSTKLYIGSRWGVTGDGTCSVNGPPPQPVDCKVVVPATIDHGVKMIGGGPSRITATTRVECSRAATVTVGVMDKDVNLSYGGHTIASTMNVGAIGSESVTTTADPISEVSLISVVQTPSMGVGGIYSGSSVVLVTWD